MKKVLIYSVLLVVGLVFSQLVPGMLGEGYETFAHVIKVLTMWALAFIMIHVGYEFDIDKTRLREYGWDYVVAATAAAFPWIFCAVYFVLVLMPEGAWQTWAAWKDSLLAGRFAAPTSAGILFSMLAAAGLATTWVFKKTRILAIFDDLDTVLLMIPLKMMIVGMKWQLGAIIVLMALMVYFAWKYLHVWRIPITWKWVLFYAALIAGASEVIYFFSKLVDEVVPIHIEVLLPAFVLGCMIAKQGSGLAKDESAHHDPHHDDVLETPGEKKVATMISAVFMVLVGLSMPALIGLGGANETVMAADAASAKSYVVGAEPVVQEASTMGWGMIAVHVLIVTVISNLGKMYPAFCYRREAHWKERLAVAVAMFPRGEVGAGVLIISLSYGIGGPVITIAMFSLALNLLLTGVFILAVQSLIRSAAKEKAEQVVQGTVPAAS